MSDPAQLLAMMQSDPSAARQMLEATIAERSASDPMLAMMMQMMNSRRPPEDVALEKRARVERVRTHVGELRAALASAHELLDDVARAVGACEACWGGDDDCRACRGRGTAGWRVPDEALFDELVAPAVRRREQQKPTKGSME